MAEDAHDPYASLYVSSAAELLAAAGYELSERSRARPTKDPRYVIERLRLTGYADLYHYKGVEYLGWFQLAHRLKPPGRFGFERLDANVWLMPDDYVGSSVEVARKLDRDCRAILLGLAEGRVLGGEQDGWFSMLIPFADGYSRPTRGWRDGEPRIGPLSAFDTTGLVDIRDLADEPFSPDARRPRRFLGHGSRLGRRGG